jgi:hypothetical protein
MRTYGAVALVELALKGNYDVLDQFGKGLQMPRRRFLTSSFAE